jgi:hypothetical protein
MLGNLIDEKEVADFDAALDELNFDEAAFEGADSAFAATGCVYSALQSCRDDPLKHSVAAALAATDAIYQSLLQKTDREAKPAYHSPVEVFLECLRIAHHYLMVEELTKQVTILRFLHDHKNLTGSDIALLQKENMQ